MAFPDSLVSLFELASIHALFHPFLATLVLITLGSPLLFFRRHFNRSAPRTLPGFEALGPVTLLTDFNWEEEAPRKWRPYKKAYNLTMGLQKCTLDDLITIDCNHLDRIHERNSILTRYGHSKILAILPRSHPCYQAADAGTKELYALLTAYLPVRYPTIFYHKRMRFPSSWARLWQPGELHSVITDMASIPTRLKVYGYNPGAYLLKIWPAAPINSEMRLRKMLHFLDEDFLVLVPAEDGEGYILGAFVNAFPQGFDTSALLGTRIRDIHAPVPGYEERLRGSMERYFEKLETGKFVRRVNWSVVTTGELYTGEVHTHSHHATHESDQQGEEGSNDFDVRSCFQRSEAQILFRLPESKALVFVIKSYLYSLQEIKDEGLGEEFADAIEGLGKGNVPEIFGYKRGPVWAESAKTFLRS